jgi:hypothetical protein
VNNTGEAYTENPVGRKAAVTPEVLVQPRKELIAVGERVNEREANMTHPRW